jgi:membrane protease subunit HflK
LQNQYNYNPEEIKEWWNKSKRQIKAVLITVAVIAVFLILISGSVYTINSGEEAVITQFGRYVRTERDPGLQFKLPFIEQRYKVSIASERRMELGFRSDNAGSHTYTTVQSELTMITGDMALVNADWVILYRVKDSYQFHFKALDIELLLRTTTEAVYRRVIASNNVDDVLTDRKDDIQFAVQRDLQDICDLYQVGIQIINVYLQDAMPPAEVVDAFIDVANAREERQAAIHRAERYSNEQLPVARGEAQRLINYAEAFKERRVNEAHGAVERYKAIEGEYLRAPGVTRTRLYLEMIREVLPSVERINFVDPNGNTLNFLPLGDLTAGPASNTAPVPPPVPPAYGGEQS